MKIYDIISESQQLNENVIIMSGFRQILKYVASRNGQGLEHAMEWIARRLAGKENAAEQLAEAWILAAEKVGIAEAIAMGAQKAARAGIGDDVITAAQRAAEKLIEKRAGSIWGQLKTPESKLNFYYGLTFKTINQGLMFWGIGEPIYKCVTSILNAYELRDSGDPELKDPAKLQWVVQYYIDQCVKQVVSLWLGNKIVNKVIGKWVPGIAYNIPIAGPLIQKLDPIYSKVPPATLVAFKSWMISNEGQEALAKWLVGQALVPYTDWKIPGGPTYQKLILDPLGGIAMTGYNKILKWTGSDKMIPEPGQKKDDKGANEPENTGPDNYNPGLRGAKTPNY